MTTEQPAPPSAPKMKYKSFAYRTGIEWLGGRAGTLLSEGKPAFRVASPPEFKGEAGVWTPEDLFVASVNVCIMATFLAFAERQKLPVEAYTCDAEGTIEFVDTSYRFTRLTLRPKIVVRDVAAASQAEKIIHDAHRNCIVSNSIHTVVTLEPQISVKPVE